MSLVAKSCVEKKKDKINTNGIQTASRLKNSESAECRISYSVDYVFVAKCCVDKNKDKIKTNGNQTASRQIISGSAECKISYCVDYVFCD